MFKKRLKGLLAMVLAGSIAATALPLSASATIIGDINVCDSNGNDTGSVPYSDISTNEATSSYLNSNNLWAILYTDTDNNGLQTMKLECVEGDKLAEHVTTMHNSSSNSYSDVKIKSEHKILVTTDDPNTNVIDTNSADTVSEFPKTIDISSYNTALQDVVSWTAWYGLSSGGNTIVASSAEKGTTKSISAGSTSISVPMDTFKALYEVDRFLPSDKFGRVVTIIQLQNSYKTFNLPVLNTVLQPEMNGSTPKTVSITEGSSGDIDGNLEDFYLCYIDRTNDTVKISNDPMSTKDVVWDKLGDFISGIANYDESKLCLVRSVTATVCSPNIRGDWDFNTKDFITGNTAGNTALRYLYVEAPAKSIWRVVANGSDKCFFATKDEIGDAIKSCLTDKPKASGITFTEQATIYVTGTTPIADGSIASENNFFTQTLKEGSLKTISELLAELTAKIPPVSGKKYDVNGWELWSAGTDCGGLINLQKINFNTSGVTGVTADMFDKAAPKRPVIYFPQVNATSSGSGGSSSRPTTPAYDPDKPTIDGVEKSWSDVARDIGKMTEGENKMIYLGGDKTIPADVIKAIKDSKAIITFRISTAFSWTVDGSTLTDGDIHDYDFSIEVITATGVEILRGDIGTGFKIGDISDGATLNINFKKEHAQKFANLYKKVDGELVFVDNVKIDENGSAIGLKVSESGEYVVMLGKFSDRSGDMDNDGILNAKDSLAVLKDFLGIESGTNPVVSDVNKDGAINSKDALEILKIFLGLE